MDFYQQNPTNLRRLLTKRQNPCTQVFKLQPSSPTNAPMTALNLPKNNFSTITDERISDFTHDNSTCQINPPNIVTPTQTAQNNPSTPGSTIENPEEDDCDAAPLERVQKKVKTSMITTDCCKSRKRSFEEEKEESDHSTTCETRSEFNLINEAGEFMLSPSMTHLNSRHPTEMKLDITEEALHSARLNCNLTADKVSQSKKAQDVAKQIGAHLAACNFQPGSKQKLKCKMNHQYEMDLSNISTKSCPRCEELLKECQEFARKNEGSCLNQEYDETIRYQCNKSHCWSLNFKNAKRRWCAQCAKEQRQFLKKKCEQEKVEREKQEEEYQRNLFEEAKRKAVKENGQQSFNCGGIKSDAKNQRPMSTLEYFQRMDYEIETLAKKYTGEFMSQKEFNGEINYQQILQVYKIVIMPEHILQSYMFNLNGDTLRSEFRRMAKMIHPDKNKHPQAGNAFQKIYKVYEVALSRLEGTQQKI